MGTHRLRARHVVSSQATLDYTLMIDYSGSMVALRDEYDAHMEARLQAVRTIEALLSSWTGGGDNLGVVRVAAFAFHNGSVTHPPHTHACTNTHAHAHAHAHAPPRTRMRYS
jgi:hypothetical protein